MKQRIGILGTGGVGKTLGKGLIDLGYEVCLGSRKSGNDSSRIWAAEAGPKASIGTFADAASFGSILIIATLGIGTENAVKMAGPENFAGKIVVDTTNPLEISDGKVKGLFVGTSDSLAERIQRIIPESRLIKGFNCVGWPLFINPKLSGGAPSMVTCGNDMDAKIWLTDLCKVWGWEILDLGDLTQARWAEALVMLWIKTCYMRGNRQHAFKLLTE